MTALPGKLSTTEAVVLRTIPYGESDVVAHLLCRGIGRVGAFARGARRSAKRFGGGIEPFTLLQVELQPPRRGADLLEFRGAIVLEPNLALRNDLGRLAHAGYATEMSRELLHDHEPHDALMDLLLRFFVVLGQSGPRSLTLRAFELGALSAAGFAPLLAHCARCGSAVDAIPVLGWDAALGGVLCFNCTGADTLRIDQAARRLLLALQDGGLNAADQASDDDLPLLAVQRAMRAFIDRHVRRDLRSLSFLREVGAPG